MLSLVCLSFFQNCVKNRMKVEYDFGSVAVRRVET